MLGTACVSRGTLAHLPHHEWGRPNPGGDPWLLRRASVFQVLLKAENFALDLLDFCADRDHLGLPYRYPRTFKWLLIKYLRQYPA